MVTQMLERRLEVADIADAAILLKVLAERLNQVDVNPPGFGGSAVDPMASGRAQAKTKALAPGVDARARNRLADSWVR